MQLSPGVHRIATPLGERHCDLILFVGTDRAVLYDVGVAGTLAAHLLPALARLGIDPTFISHVVLSHCDVDHFGDVGSVRDLLPAARVVAHAADAPLMEHYDSFLAGRGHPFAALHDVDDTPAGLEWLREVTREGPVDLRVEGGEQLNLGDRVVRLVSIPGHSRGQLAIHDPQANLWAISDGVLGSAVPLADGTPAFPPTYRHVAEYRASIAALQSARPTILVTAHYGAFTDEAAQAFLTESQEFTELMEQRVLEAVRRHGGAEVSVADLVHQIDPTIGAWPHPAPPAALAFPVVGHLEDLAARGLVSYDISGHLATVSAR